MKIYENFVTNKVWIDACYKKDYDTIIQLIKKDFDINIIINDHGDNALIYFLNEYKFNFDDNAKEIIYLLIDKTKDLNYQNKYSESALITISNNIKTSMELDILKKILYKNVNMFLTDNKNHDFYYYAKWTQFHFLINDKYKKYKIFKEWFIGECPRQYKEYLKQKEIKKFKI